MRLIETDTNANKDINAAVAVGAYTATATRGVIVRLLADQVAGGGDYIAYVTVQLAGAGSHYRIIPLTTGTAAAALTAIGFVSIPVPVDTGDVLTVYIDGLAGDTTTPDVRVDFYEQDYLRPSVAGRTLDIEATGEVSANVTYLAGQSEPVDNLVLALGNSDGITAHPQGIADAMKLAPTAGTPADGSVDDHLDDLATALAAATSTLTIVSAVDGDVITIYQAVSFQATISGLAIPAGWTKVYWTVKRATSEADTDAILQLVETNPSAGTDGLLRVNGAAGTAGNGSLTVDQAVGTVVIDLLMTVCDDLALATGLVWSLKALHPTSAATLLATGTVNVLGQATAAVA